LEGEVVSSIMAHRATGSLGTITPQGIWTHDHIRGADPYWPNDASGYNEALLYLGSWRCISFTGVNGTITVDAASLNVIDHVDGAILIDHNVLTISGTSANWCIR
jgi:hypothetical protein